jgi:hypothetical protein
MFLLRSFIFLIVIFVSSYAAADINVVIDKTVNFKTLEHNIGAKRLLNVAFTVSARSGTVQNAITSVHSRVMLHFDPDSMKRLFTGVSFDDSQSIEILKNSLFPSTFHFVLSLRNIFSHQHSYYHCEQTLVINNKDDLDNNKYLFHVNSTTLSACQLQVLPRKA